MKYHYLRGARRTHWKRNVGRVFYTLMALLFIIIAWDLIFNYSEWTIEALIYTSERL